MTRGLHPKTKPQRAQDPGAIPEEKRRQGYEDRDAPPRMVAMGVAVFYAIMLLGIAFAAATIAVFAPRMGLSAHAPPPPVFPNASLPPLLVRPTANRAAVEQQAQRNLKPVRIEQAMEQVETQQQTGGEER